MKSGMEEKKNARVQPKNFLIKNANQMQLEMTDN